VQNPLPTLSTTTNGTRSLGPEERGTFDQKGTIAMDPIQQLMASAGAAMRQSREALQAASAARDETRRELSAMAQAMAELRGALQQVQLLRAQGDPTIQRIEDVPGRRVPMDLLVDIPLSGNTTSTETGTITISQEGPFVAVARYATFMSAHAFSVRDPENPGTVATFSGRSNGRFRLIHSAWDLNDGQPTSEVTQVVAFPGTGAPHVASPSNSSPFRSMTQDLRILFRDSGSSFPRSNNTYVPSTFWVKGVNNPFPLGALDFFERGSVLQFNVLPMHPSNPPFGNVFGFGAPNPLYPFNDSGYDAIEGISDPNLLGVSADPVTRIPSGILTIGFHGYLIVQPTGAGPR